MSALFQQNPSAGPARKARIEIIPLIDVIFFLLATFVLFTLSLNKIQAVPVVLPQASANIRPSDVDDSVVLQASDAGSAYWNRELISFDEIKPRLANYKATVASPRVLVSGDDHARYGVVVRILDEVRQAGISAVTIETAYRSSGH